MFSRELFEVCNGNHVMLVCENDTARHESAAYFINEGLESDQLCVYASVHAFDRESNLNISNLSHRIINYESNLKSGNLKIIDFKPFYESAAASNLTPFVLLKERLESTLSDRISCRKTDKILVYADAACHLAQHEEFQESTRLEKWWQHTHDEWTNKDDKITVICPHLAQILREEQEVKWNIADVHDVMIFLNSHLRGSNRSNVTGRNNLRILIAESEPDIVTLFSHYMNDLGHDVSVVTSGYQCISLFRKRDFDLVILDTHLTGYLTSGDVVREIMRIEPHQRIIVTSTNDPADVSCALGDTVTQKPQILQKPFHLSMLAKVVEQTTRNN